MRFGLTRETVLKRVTDAGIKPILDEPKKKIYEMTPELIAAVNKRSDLIDAVKLRHEEAKARFAEVKVDEIEGRIVKVSEVIDTTQQLFGATHRELAIRMPKEIASKLAKAKTAAAVQKILKLAIDRRFKTLRDNFEKFLT